MAWSAEQKQTLRELHRRRPDLVASTETADGPEYSVLPYELGKLGAEDTEGAEVIAALIRTIASSATLYQNGEICRCALPALERAAGRDAGLAKRIAEELDAAEFPPAHVLPQVAHIVRRLEAIVSGKCGCSLKPLPYWEPADAAFMSIVAKRRISEDGYVTVDEFDIRCERCNAPFVVTKKTDYDRWSYTWKRMASVMPS